MVPPSSNRISRVPPYLFVYLVPHITFRVQGYHLLWPSFPECSAKLGDPSFFQELLIQLIFTVKRYFTMRLLSRVYMLFSP